MMDKVEEEEKREKGSPSPRRQKIKFNLDKSGLSCFISKKPLRRKSRDKKTHGGHPGLDREIPLHPLKKQCAPQCHPLSYFDRHFNHQVLFTQYDQQQVYVDSQNSTNSTKIPQQEPIDEYEANHEDDFVVQCVRVITEETSDKVSDAGIFPNPEQTIKAISPTKYQPHHLRNTSLKEINYQINLYNVDRDGRTTIMLRNIPNKYTQEMILQQIDDCGLYRKYDFFYLPIDYKNDCNVGYAFINLISTQFILRLYEEFNGKKWRRFNSEKICEVCYARLQGTAQLMNHFRYSNVITQKDYKSKPLIYLNLETKLDKTSNQL